MFRSPPARLLGALLILTLAQAPVFSADPAEGQTNRFELRARSVHIPERGDVLSYLLLAEESQFSFIPPPRWQVRSNARKREISLMPTNLLASLRIHVARLDSPGRPEVNGSALRAEVQSRFPGAKLVREFTCHTSGSHGMAFDLERPAANRLRIMTRVAFVPFSEGWLEFTLSGPPAKFEQYHLTFGNLLASFREETPN